MAIRSVRVDDLDGTSDDVRPVETYKFSAFGIDYEIDLHQENADKLRETLVQWITPARQRSPKASAKPAKTDKSQLDAIRQWAHSHGYEFSDRGRIPVHVMEAFQRLASPSVKQRAVSTVLSAPGAEEAAPAFSAR